MRKSGLFLCLAVLISCSKTENVDMEEFYKLYEDQEDIHSQLLKVSELSFLFGHQSVGYNIIDGLKGWMEETGIYFDVVESRDLSLLEKPGLLHFKVGQNENPYGKIDDFISIINQVDSGHKIIAGFKLCYVDISDTTDVESLFKYYKAKMYALQEDKPNIKIILFTAPYIALQRGTRAVVKQILFMPLYGELGNINKYRFNQMLRDQLSDDFPVFDLAKIEATQPDGSLTSHKYKGESYPALSYIYTDDMGHLNRFGAKVVASNLITFLASLNE